MRRLPQTRNRPSATASAASGIQRLLTFAVLADPPTRQRRVCGRRSGPDLARYASNPQREAPTRAQRRDLKAAERRRSAGAEQALVRYGVLNAEATRSAPGKGWKLNRGKPALLRHKGSSHRTVAIWRNCDNPGPIGVALADPVADAWQAANPHLLRAQALGLAGRRVGGRPPRRERIAA
jgi:hypothetical protein